MGQTRYVADANYLILMVPRFRKTIGVLNRLAKIRPDSQTIVHTQLIPGFARESKWVRCQKKLPNAPARTRTLDPLIKSQLLYRLSYRGGLTQNQAAVTFIK